jgi:hypothetical protein
MAKKNYIDKKGNYQNVENLSLAQIYDRGHEDGYKLAKAEIIGKYEERPKGECKTCIHRDPEDKKCDCGALERAGCPFPVSDDYFCKFYEKGGAEE